MLANGRQHHTKVKTARVAIEVGAVDSFTWALARSRDSFESFPTHDPLRRGFLLPGTALLRPSFGFATDPAATQSTRRLHPRDSTLESPPRRRQTSSRFQRNFPPSKGWSPEDAGVSW